MRQPDARADARAVRVAAGRRRQHRVARAADARRESRLPDGVLREDGTLARYTAVGSPTIYRGDRLPAELYGNVFLAESAGNLVGRLIVSDDGTTLRARSAYERAEFLASTDERFRPVWLASAPDGTLYVVDMYRGVIQHRVFITEYLRDWIVERNLEQAIGYGRIYRVVHDDDAPRAASRRCRARRRAQLVDALSHPNGWWRDTAQQLLVQRGDTSAVPALRQLAARAPLTRTRLHALWTLDGMDAIDPAIVMRALERSDRATCAPSALRLSERWLGSRRPVQAAVLKRSTIPTGTCAASSPPRSARCRQASREPPIAPLLERHGDDPVDGRRRAQRRCAAARAAVLDIAAAGDARADAAAARRSRCSRRRSSAAARRPRCRTCSMSHAERRGRSGSARRSCAAPRSPCSGAAAGHPARGRGAAAADAPCQTCPGGRGGPGGGGASAFPAVRTLCSRDRQLPRGDIPFRRRVRRQAHA